MPEGAATDWPTYLWSLAPARSGSAYSPAVRLRKCGKLRMGRGERRGGWERANAASGRAEGMEWYEDRVAAAHL